MPNSGFSWGAKLSDIADAVWTRAVRQLSDAENIKNAISDAVWERSERKLTNLDDVRAGKIDNLDVAVSSRSTNAGVWEYSTRGLTEAVQNVMILAGGSIRAEANTERTTRNTSFTKIKEFRVFASGSVEVEWEMKTTVANENVFAAVFINGALASEIFQNSSTSYERYLATVNIQNGDYVQVYFYSNLDTVTVYLRNCKLKYTIAGGETATPQVTLD